MTAHVSMRTPGETSWDWCRAHAICLRESRRVLGADDAAEDAAQEAVLRAWRRRRTCATPQEPAPWLAAIARREALRLADRRREVAEPDATAADPPRDGALLLGIDVRRALRALEPDDRRLVLARYWEDQTHVQAAKRLGLSESTAKVRLHRARARLRDMLLET